MIQPEPKLLPVKLVTIHLPMDMRQFAALLTAIARIWPKATISDTGRSDVVEVSVMIPEPTTSDQPERPQP